MSVPFDHHIHRRPVFEFIKTGERRTPKQGEWFIPEATAKDTPFHFIEQAPHDYALNPNLERYIVEFKSPNIHLYIPKLQVFSYYDAGFTDGFHCGLGKTVYRYRTANRMSDIDPKHPSRQTYDEGVEDAIGELHFYIDSLPPALAESVLL
jgi:hypothetical protein